jgi:hypothetical protein
MPICPDPMKENAVTEWNRMKDASAFTKCAEEGSGEPTCVLGRFRVTTFITDSKVNVTSHGTTTGCAKKKLLNYIASATSKSKCSMVTAKSPVRENLQHTLEIEHCPDLSDMCSDADYCIFTKATKIKPFNSSLPEEKGSNLALKILLGVVGAAAMLGLLLSMMGMKYDAVRMRN